MTPLQKYLKEVKQLKAENAKMRHFCMRLNEWCSTDDAARALPFEPPWYAELLDILTSAELDRIKAEGGE